MKLLESVPSPRPQQTSTAKVFDQVFLETLIRRWTNLSGTPCSGVKTIFRPGSRFFRFGGNYAFLGGSIFCFNGKLEQKISGHNKMRRTLRNLGVTAPGMSTLAKGPAPDGTGLMPRDRRCTAEQFATASRRASAPAACENPARARAVVSAFPCPVRDKALIQAFHCPAAIVPRLDATLNDMFRESRFEAFSGLAARERGVLFGKALCGR